VQEGETPLAYSRYKQSGPVNAGDYIHREGDAGGYCTAGFGATQTAGLLRGVSAEKDFVLSAGHCFGLESRALRKGSPSTTEYVTVGQTRRTGYRVPNGAGGAPNVDASAILLSDPSYLSGQIYYGSNSTLLRTTGVATAPVGTIVCDSGVSAAIHCGPVVGVKWIINDGYAHEDIVARAGAATGNSGGPVWIRETGQAVGLASTLWGNECHELASGQKYCKAMSFTPLIPFANDANPQGALTYMGLYLYTER
jgi:hypothetical protein